MKLMFLTNIHIYQHKHMQMYTHTYTGGWNTWHEKEDNEAGTVLWLEEAFSVTFRCTSCSEKLGAEFNSNLGRDLVFVPHWILQMCNEHASVTGYTAVGISFHCSKVCRVTSHCCNSGQMKYTIILSLVTFVTFHFYYRLSTGLVQKRTDKNCSSTHSEYFYFPPDCLQSAHFCFWYLELQFIKNYRWVVYSQNCLFYRTLLWCLSSLSLIFTHSFPNISLFPLLLSHFLFFIKSHHCCKHTHQAPPLIFMYSFIAFWCKKVNEA